MEPKKNNKQELIEDEILSTWLILRTDLVKLVGLLEQETPGFITEPLTAIKALTAAMVKRNELINKRRDG